MAIRPDINDIGVMYVKSKLRQEQQEERSFIPGSIQDWELRDGFKRMLSDPYNLYYNREVIRRMNKYQGMWL
jgi:hypothetical protein